MRMVMALAAAMLASAALAQGTPHERIIADSESWPWRSVGRINFAGLSRRLHCTGTLVAPDLVLTAAHCLIHPKTGDTPRLEDIHFLAGASRGAYAAHGRVACVAYLGGVEAQRRSRAEDRFLSDAAVIRLTEPMDLDPVPVEAADAPPEKGARLDYAGYPRERAHVLSLDEGCAVVHGDERLWVTDCAANHGGSGGPLFRQGEGTPRLGAIMVAISGDGLSYALPASAWRGLLEGGACAAE